MEKLPPLIKAMKQPGFYPHPVSEPIKLIQTHISYVFLTGDYAYKIKKPVDFGFLDFSTTEKRKLYCNEEVRLNSRAAPGYYLQVLAIAKDGSDHYFFSDEKSQDQAQIVEYCVHMKQFPSGQLFSERLKSGQLDNGHMLALGRKVAQFHAKCTTNETVLSFGNISIIRKAIDENYAQTEKYVAAGIQTRQQIDETKKYTDNYFATKEHLFKKRMDKKKIIEGHGDLHLRNITLDGDEIVLFDCIEFSEEFRFIDTMYDIGFVIVGLESKGKFEMANEFLNEYLERTADWEGVEILRIYLSRQAYVKAKVKSFMYDDANVADDIKQENIRDARVYYTLSWSYTQVTPGKIFIMCGLSGSGKSTIGKKIAFKHRAVHIRSDAVRKHICNVPLEERGGNEIYTKEVSQKTYEYMIDVACRLVPEGWNVILDATYAKVEYRQSVIEKCQAANIEMKIIYCTAPVDELRRRVRDRKGDITDANEKVLEMQLKCFDAPNKAEERYTVTIDTTKDIEPQLNQVQS